MADRLNERFDSGPYAYASALFYYCGNYVELTKSLKFRRNFAAGKYFSSLLAAEIRSSPYLSDIDFVTCVPLHWTRKFQRGYNQAEIIAVRIAAETGACFGNVLVRTRRTARQARIGGTDKAQARWKNVSGSFKVRNAGKLKGYRHILVVDDVFTTGATLYSCFAAVRNAVGNDVRISVATLAYAGGG